MRLFIVGNGPSLAITPMDKLIGEDTFAMNNIHLLYPKTKWRPTYFSYLDFISDSPYWRNPIDENRNVVKKMWLLDFYRNGLPEGHVNYADFPKEKAVGEIENAVWVPRCKRHTGYSPESERGMKEWHLPDICTSVNGISAAFQIAVTLGYDEIFLVGCDLGYVFDYHKNHFSPEYTQGKIPKYAHEAAFWALSDQHGATVAHQIAKMECEKRGIKIYNATIGGQLEVHPRVELERVLNG